MSLPYVLGGEHKLTKTEEKYCSCLMHVRPKTGNPYGICTKTVYGEQRRDKVVDCDLHYNYSKYNKEELDAFAKEKKMNSRMSKDKLVEKLQNRTKYYLKKY
jgi:hypothetical protein